MSLDADMKPRYRWHYAANAWLRPIEDWATSSWPACLRVGGNKEALLSRLMSIAQKIA